MFRAAAEKVKKAAAKTKEDGLVTTLLKTPRLAEKAVKNYQNNDDNIRLIPNVRLNNYTSKDNMNSSNSDEQFKKQHSFNTKQEAEFFLNNINDKIRSIENFEPVINLIDGHLFDIDNKDGFFYIYCKYSGTVILNTTGEIRDNIELDKNYWTNVLFKRLVDSHSHIQKMLYQCRGYKVYYKLIKTFADYIYKNTKIKGKISKIKINKTILGNQVKLLLSTEDPNYRNYLQDKDGKFFLTHERIEDDDYDYKDKTFIEEILEETDLDILKNHIKIADSEADKKAEKYGTYEYIIPENDNIAILANRKNLDALYLHKYPPIEDNFCDNNKGRDTAGTWIINKSLGVGGKGTRRRKRGGRKSKAKKSSKNKTNKKRKRKGSKKSRK